MCKIGFILWTCERRDVAILASDDAPRLLCVRSLSSVLGDCSSLFAGDLVEITSLPGDPPGLKFRRINAAQSPVDLTRWLLESAKKNQFRDDIAVTEFGDEIYASANSPGAGKRKIRST